MNIASNRERALTAIDFEFSKMDDLTLDDWARSILGLPFRPKGAKPFVGWLLPTIKAEKAKQPKMTISKTGVKLIQDWEGYRSKAYVCSAGVWTIGWGHTATARRGMRIDKSEGQRLFNKDIQVYVNAVNRLVSVPLNQNQFDALVSFCFNLGAGALSNSSLLRELNKGNYKSAANWFERYVYGGGRKLEGLIRRRKAERKLFEL